MVPVGGSIIYSPKSKGVVTLVNSMYPGRASSGPIVDLFLTFLEMGEKNFKQLLKERKENFTYLKEKL